MRALWGDLLDRAERGELWDNGTALAPFDLNVRVMKLLYDPKWARLGEFLRGLSESEAGTQGLAAAGAERQPQGKPEPALEANPFEVFCQDWSLPVRDYEDYARKLRRVTRIAPDMKYPRALMSVSACLGTPEPDNPQHRLKVRKSRPILLSNSLHDPASGYSWATKVADQLGDNAILHTYRGWGHGTYSSSPCAQKVIDDYLISLKVPAREASCPAVDPRG
ncbi:alpha/beta hydrolase [Streptomyces sp. PmtG]